MRQLQYKAAAGSNLPPGPMHLLSSPVAGRSWPETGLARIRPALLTLFIWTAVGIFQAAPETLQGFDWPKLLTKLTEAWAWALLTPAILLLNRRLTAAYPNIVHLAGIQLALSIPFSLVHTYIAGAMVYPVVEIWWNPLRSTEFFIYYFLGGWMTYCAFIGLLQTFNFYNRFLTSQFELERVEKRLVESRLNALRLQLEPHFLFNALNTISSEVTASPELAREMIENLGALLRRSLECQESNEISLAQELALVDRYLAIQKLRFGERIEIRIDVDPETFANLVPSMLLQPLIENAIRHGLEGRMLGGTVIVTARHVGRHLQIRVSDDGVGLPPQWRMETCAGLGIRVTRERLEALYPGLGEFGFSVSRQKVGGTEVLIHIPLDRTGADPGGN